jgi:hypothetical protein
MLLFVNTMRHLAYRARKARITGVFKRRATPSARRLRPANAMVLTNRSTWRLGRTGFVYRGGDLPQTLPALWAALA